jgi:protein TonB
MKAPDPSEPPEPEYDYGDAAEGEGVVGGVVGPGPERDRGRAGVRDRGLPQAADGGAGCVQRSVRIRSSSRASSPVRSP